MASHKICIRSSWFVMELLCWPKVVIFDDNWLPRPIDTYSVPWEDDNYTTWFIFTLFVWEYHCDFEVIIGNMYIGM